MGRSPNPLYRIAEALKEPAKKRLEELDSFLSANTEDSAGFLTDETGIILNCQGKALENLSISPEEIKSTPTPVLDLLFLTDKTQFLEAVHVASDKKVSGFYMGAGIHAPQQKNLRHYRLSARTIRDERETLVALTLGIMPETENWQPPEQCRGEIIRLPNQPSLVDITRQAEKGKRYVLDLRGTRLTEEVLEEIRKAFRCPNISLIGVKDLTGTEYCAARHLAILTKRPRQDLGIKGLSYTHQNGDGTTWDYEKPKAEST